MTTQKETQNIDIQGEFLGMPYDFRRPSKAKILSRIWNENGPLFPPKTWGMGWTLNFKHPAGPYVLTAILAIPTLALVAAFFIS
jgi:hypothetical protein